VADHSEKAMKRCFSLALINLAVGALSAPGQIVPSPVTYPDLFSPASQVTVTPPAIPLGSILAVYSGGSATGDLGTHWTATASGGAVLGSNLGVQLRVAETGASVDLTGSALRFRLTNNPDSILGALTVGTSVNLSWSATATLDAAGNEYLLKPNTTYRLQFNVNTGGGLLGSVLSISPSFGVELLNGDGQPVGYSGGGSLVNLIGLPLVPVLGAPSPTGQATVEFRTGATVPAGAARIRFTGGATLPLSVAGIGTEFATISALSIVEVPAYVEWAEDNDLTGDDLDPADDPDGDGRSNFDEFALGTDPNRGDGGNIHVAVGDADGEGPETSVLVMTLPVRDGAIFTADGNGNRTGTADGVSYRVQGSFDLQAWTAAISEVTPNSAFTNNLPTLDAGWTYRSFRVPGQTADTPRAFLRVIIE
jgi:hypothetical protein